MNEVIKNKAPRIDPKSLKIPASGDYTAENISGSGPPESNIHLITQNRWTQRSFLTRQRVTMAKTCQLPYLI